MAFTEKGHINRRTKFENPFLEAKRCLEQQRQSLPPKYRECHPRATLCRGDPLPGATAQAPELLTVTMVKGLKGFGFAIVPSPNGQQVLEPGSQGASGLMEGDLILEVNQQPVAAAGHGRVVELLRECPVGAEATLLIQRAGTGKIAMEKRCSTLIRAPFRETDITDSGVSMTRASSMFDLPKLQRAPFSETDSTDSGASMKSASSMFGPPNFNLHRKQRAPFRETDSTDSGVSMTRASSMFDLPKLQRAPFSETDSTDSGASMKSASSMFGPPNFNLHRKQSCAVCEEAVKDPILLPCGHRSCTECSHSFWDEYGLTADDPCKKCGRRSEREKRDQDLRSVLLEKTIKRVEMETERIQAEKEKFQAEKEKFQAEKEKFQAEKGSFQAEKEKSQAEKEKFQAKKEKIQAEKEKIQAEKGSFRAEKAKFRAEKEKLQAEKEKFELEKRKLALEIQSLELNGKYTNYYKAVVIPKIRIPYF